MVKNSVYKNGSVIAVWVKADNRDELNYNYWSFYNHGATNAEDLNWTDELEGYFWTNRNKLKKYFKNSSAAIVYNELGEDWAGDKVTGPEIQRRIMELAEKRLIELLETVGHNPLAKTPFNSYAMGTIQTDRPSGDWSDYLTKLAQGA